VEEQETHREVIVKGHREKPAGFHDDDGMDLDHRNSFGLFKLTFPIDDNRFSSKPTIEFHDSTLKIIIARKGYGHCGTKPICEKADDTDSFEF
jgi:hypothetical protein